MVHLYSADFFEAFAEYYCMAGGVFAGPKSLESDPELRLVKCAKPGESPAEIDAKILCLPIL